MQRAKILLILMALFAFVGGMMAVKATKKYGSILYTTAIRCASAAVTVEATIAQAGLNKVYVTSVYNQPACLYTYTLFHNLVNT